MQINNYNSQSFGSTKIYMSKMNNAQRDLSQSIAYDLRTNDEYRTSSDNNFDMYILPAENNNVNVRYMDHISHCYMRDDSNKIINTQVGAEQFSESIDNIKEQLKQVSDFKFKRPTLDIDKFAEEKTDLAQLRPSLYRRLPMHISGWQASLHNNYIDSDTLGKTRAVSEFINKEHNTSHDEIF